MTDRHSVAVAEEPPLAPENDARAVLEALLDAGDIEWAHVGGFEISGYLVEGLAARGFAVVRLEDRQSWANLAIRGAVHRDVLLRLHAAEAAVAAIPTAAAAAADPATDEDAPTASTPVAGEAAAQPEGARR